MWYDRKRRVRQIGRMHPLSPRQPAYYVRCLLTVVRGPTSFEDLRTIDGIEYETFQEACYAAGVLSRDNEWENCFQRACQLRTGRELRYMFASAMTFSALDKLTAPRIWTRFADEFTDDLLYRITSNPADYRYPRPWTCEHAAHDYGLYELHHLLQRDEYSLSDFGLPEYDYDWEGDARPPNPIIAAEQAYDQASPAREADGQVQNLSPSQKAAYDRIMDALQSDSQSAFFIVNGSGGTEPIFTLLFAIACGGKGRLSSAWRQLGSRRLFSWRPHGSQTVRSAHRRQ